MTCAVQTQFAIDCSFLALSGQCKVRQPLQFSHFVDVGELTANYTFAKEEMEWETRLVTQEDLV